MVLTPNFNSGICILKEQNPPGGRLRPANSVPNALGCLLPQMRCANGFAKLPSCLFGRKARFLY